jgi:hypothetical protein
MNQPPFEPENPPEEPPATPETGPDHCWQCVRRRPCPVRLLAERALIAAMRADSAGPPDWAR